MSSALAALASPMSGSSRSKSSGPPNRRCDAPLGKPAPRPVTTATTTKGFSFGEWGKKGKQDDARTPYQFVIAGTVVNTTKQTASLSCGPSSSAKDVDQLQRQLHQRLKAERELRKGKAAAEEKRRDAEAVREAERVAREKAETAKALAEKAVRRAKRKEIAESAAKAQAEEMYMRARDALSDAITAQLEAENQAAGAIASLACAQGMRQEAERRAAHAHEARDQMDSAREKAERRQAEASTARDLAEAQRQQAEEALKSEVEARQALTDEYMETKEALDALQSKTESDSLLLDDMQEQHALLRGRLSNLEARLTNSEEAQTAAEERLAKAMVDLDEAETAREQAEMVAKLAKEQLQHLPKDMRLEVDHALGSSADIRSQFIALQQKLRNAMQVREENSELSQEVTELRQQLEAAWDAQQQAEAGRKQAEEEAARAMKSRAAAESAMLEAGVTPRWYLDKEASLLSDTGGVTSSGSGRIRRRIEGWTAKEVRQARSIIEQDHTISMKAVEAAAAAERARQNELKLRSRASTFTKRASRIDGDDDVDAYAPSHGAGSGLGGSAIAGAGAGAASASASASASVSASVSASASATDAEAADRLATLYQQLDRETEHVRRLERERIAWTSERRQIEKGLEDARAQRMAAEEARTKAEKQLSDAWTDAANLRSTLVELQAESSQLVHELAMLTQDVEANQDHNPSPKTVTPVFKGEDDSSSSSPPMLVGVKDTATGQTEYSVELRPYSKNTRQRSSHAGGEPGGESNTGVEESKDDGLRVGRHDGHRKHRHLDADGYSDSEDDNPSVPPEHLPLSVSGSSRSSGFHSHNLSEFPSSLPQSMQSCQHVPRGTTLYMLNGDLPLFTAGHAFWTSDGFKAVDLDVAEQENPTLECTELQPGDQVFKYGSRAQGQTTKRFNALTVRTIDQFVAQRDMTLTGTRLYGSPTYHAAEYAASLFYPALSRPKRGVRFEDDGGHAQTTVALRSVASMQSPQSSLLGAASSKPSPYHRARPAGSGNSGDRSSSSSTASDGGLAVDTSKPAPSSPSKAPRRKKSPRHIGRPPRGEYFVVKAPEGECGGRCPIADPRVYVRTYHSGSRRFVVEWDCCKANELPSRCAKPRHHSNTSVVPIDCPILSER